MPTARNIMSEHDEIKSRSQSVPRMTRQDFKFIADVIHDVNFPRESFPDYHNVDRIAIVQAFTDALKHTNPNFRAGTFVEACGVDVADIEGIN